MDSMHGSLAFCCAWVDNQEHYWWVMVIWSAVLLHCLRMISHRRVWWGISLEWVLWCVPNGVLVVAYIGEALCMWIEVSAYISVTSCVSNDEVDPTLWYNLPATNYSLETTIITLCLELLKCPLDYLMVFLCILVCGLQIGTSLTNVQIRNK